MAIGQAASIVGSGAACDGVGSIAGDDHASASVLWLVPLKNPPEAGTCVVAATFADGSTKTSTVTLSDPSACEPYPDQEVRF